MGLFACSLCAGPGYIVVMRKNDAHLSIIKTFLLFLSSLRMSCLFAAVPWDS